MSGISSDKYKETLNSCTKLKNQIDYFAKNLKHLALEVSAVCNLLNQLHEPNNRLK